MRFPKNNRLTNGPKKVLGVVGILLISISLITLVNLLGSEVDVLMCISAGLNFLLGCYFLYNIYKGESFPERTHRFYDLLENHMVIKPSFMDVPKIVKYESILDFEKRDQGLLIIYRKNNQIIEIPIE